MSDQPTFPQLALIYGEANARARLAAPALPEIRAALPRAPASILNRPVALHREIFAATAGLALPVSRAAYLDVPLEKIVALSHKNFARDATTWRTLLEGLHGVGWGWDMLDYCEGPFGDKSPPLDDASGPLRLQAYGGALIGTNGMHRLVAAVCWLAANHDVDATLRKVEVSYRPVNRAALKSMRSALDAGAHVDAARRDGCPTVYLRAHVRGHTRYWAVEGRRAVPIQAPGGWLGHLRRRLNGPAADEAALVWQPVSRELVAALADTGWLRTQLASPRCPDQPN